ncbi:hypothetical protein [Lacinutrix sp. MEBiC02595]
MRKLILLLLIISFYGCEKIDDDFNNVCESECTVIEGTFTTANNEPIKNVKVELDYRASTGTYGVSVRNIRQTTTDNNGYYRMEFFIEDNELGENAEGYFRLQADVSEVENINNYIIPSQNLEGFNNWDVIYSITTRDTIIDKSFYVPTKAILNVNLTNFNPIQENDFFKVISNYPGGSFGINADNINNQTIEVFVAENENNNIKISKRKNGIYTEIEELNLFIPDDETLELNYEY